MQQSSREIRVSVEACTLCKHDILTQGYYCVSKASTVIDCLSVKRVADQSVNSSRNAFRFAQIFTPFVGEATLSRIPYHNGNRSYAAAFDRDDFHFPLDEPLLAGFPAAPCLRRGR